MKIREDQVEGRRLRLEAKKAKLERLENPPVPVPTKFERKGKKPGAQTVRAKRPEPEEEPAELPYLPTPDEIIFQREGMTLEWYSFTSKR